MMDLKQTLQPLPVEDSAHALHGCPIRPKSYVLIDGLWTPYEYEFGNADELPTSVTCFFDQIKSRIEVLGLKYIGLRRYSPDDHEELEATEAHGVSVKVPWSSADDTGAYKTTFWAFPSGGVKDYRCSCSDTGSATNPNHQHTDKN